ncbi:MAG TPA: DNA polymerase III subunit delta' [Burkholderiales bacterium]|nr:DNA polymerase III subunit delta' [Burkholderiales bacterium]
MTALAWHRAELERIAASRASLPHALLLHGPRGIGKLAFAQALARSLLCEAPAAGGTACGACSACLWFAAGTHPDYRVIEPAGAGTDEEGEQVGRASTVIAVDQIRALFDFVNMSSHRGRAKAVVLHPAEALNVNAANALLKALEEPPPRTHFLLVSHRPHLLLPTIKSRCRKVPLHAPDPKGASAWLASQGVRNADLALAHVGDAPLLALELQETDYWGARAAFLRQLTATELDVLKAAEALRDVPVPYVIAWLQKWSYDIAHYQAAGRVRYNPDHVDAIARAATESDRLAVLRFHREMVQLQRDAQHPLNARLFIEQVLLAYRDALGAARVPA